ncbi:hypothetical protein [uncultured Catenibacterium sp.]|uniref:hypothetical protein n=1 Tax=uncultured Catenibacterium sp. TaxID=286142 RepID=UPI0026273D84|nr:hypothetical protein [uncultured Catenibacterium sp.]
MSKERFHFDDEEEAVIQTPKKKAEKKPTPKEMDIKSSKESKKKIQTKYVVLGIVAVLLLAFGIYLYSALRDEGPVYGDRCEGLVTVQKSVLDDTMNEAKSKYSSIASIDIETACKQLKVDITFNNGTSVKTAEEVSKEVVKILDSKGGQAAYEGSSYSELLNKHNGVKQYEVNLYLTGGNDTDYPIYGTKQAGKDDIGFTLSSVKDQETTNKVKATEQ